MMEKNSLCKSFSANKRLFYFDFLRAVACISVVMMHASSTFTVAEESTFDFWIGNLFNSLSQAGVPLFVMISGALMLDENYSFTKKKWIDHIAKMILFYGFWSTVHSVCFYGLIPLFKQERVDVIRVIQEIITGHFHLWFVPMIVGLYLLVPLFRLWVKNTNRKYVEYFLILSVIYAFCVPHFLKILVHINPNFNFLYKLYDNMHMKYPVGYSSYFVLGWYLHTSDLSKWKKRFVGMGIGGMCMTLLGTYGIFALTNMDAYLFYDNFAVNVLLYSAGIFACAKTHLSSVQYSPSVFHKIIKLISRYSLGIYAVHIIVRTMMNHVFSQVHALIALPAILGTCLLLSAALSFLISKIPFICKFV